MRLVIIGGGIAGTTVADEVRKLDTNADITLISEEQHPLYSRVLLPHYAKGKVPRERVFLKKEEWYYERNIQWLPGVRAELVDTRNQFVRTSEGREYEYDVLVLAGGMDVRSLLDEPRGVSYWRTVDDTDHLLELIQSASADAKTVVYGGGFMACEYINTFVHHNLKPTVMMRGPWFWSGVLGQESGTLINAHIAAQGITVYPNTQVEECVDEQGVLAAVRTTHETMPANILGVGIGVKPDFSILQDTGIECDEGIRVNAQLQTSVPNVYACGDVAQFEDVHAGRERVVGNWMNAQMQARTLAKTICGSPTTFDLVSSYATNVLGLECIFIGDTQRSAAEHVQVKGAARDGSVVEGYVRNGKLVGVTMIGSSHDRAKYTQAIKEGRTWEEVAT